LTTTGAFCRCHRFGHGPPEEQGPQHAISGLQRDIAKLAMLNNLIIATESELDRHCEGYGPRVEVKPAFAFGTKWLRLITHGAGSEAQRISKDSCPGHVLAELPGAPLKFDSLARTIDRGVNGTQRRDQLGWRSIDGARSTLIQPRFLLSPKSTSNSKRSIKALRK